MQNAMGMLEGSVLGKATLAVSVDNSSKDGTKLIIRGLPVETQWQDLKDRCSQAGQVAFVAIKPPNMVGGNTEG
eukprot:12900869-Prorocentrum_lima.AAC.1